MRKVIVVLILCLVLLIHNIVAFCEGIDVNQSNISKIVCGFEGHNVNFKFEEEQIRKYNEYSYCAESETEIKYLLHLLSAFDISILEEDRFFSTGHGYRISIQYATETNTEPMEIRYSSASEGSYRMGTPFVKWVNYERDDLQIINSEHYDYEITDDSLDKFMGAVKAINRGDIIIDDSSISQEVSPWAKNEIKTAIESNLVPKWNQLNYQGKINRLETCQIVANYMSINGYTRDKWPYIYVTSEPRKLNGSAIQYAPAPFSDINDVSVNCLYGYEIVHGKAPKEFCPYDRITREEFAKILSKAYHYVKKDAEIIETENMYADYEEISEWSRSYVIEMTALDILQGEDNGYFNPKGEITKEQVIVALLRLNNLQTRGSDKVRQGDGPRPRRRG